MEEKHDEHRLVRLLQNGDVVAFDSLFEVYSPKLFGFSMKYFKNERDAEELVQDVFVQVWENRQSLKSELSFKSYLFTIALNQIRKHFNKKAVSLRYLESLRDDPENENNLSIQNDDYELNMRQIELMIDQLPPRRREIFIMSKIEGKSSKEIAYELNISAGTVDNQVSEAIRSIRAQLKNQNLNLLLFAALFVY
jgi:RNA polymerase sigma-70 factor (ECF subfamily)